MRFLLCLLLLAVCLISPPAFSDGLTLFPNGGGDDKFANASGSLLLFGGTDPFSYVQKAIRWDRP
jgi:hypothetical protein